MSLYYEAAEVLQTSARDGAGSIESIVFGKKDWKSPAKTLFALAIETAKWSRVLKDVIERSGLLEEETQLDSVLVLALVHDLLLSKKGIALPHEHGLSKCIAKHKTRLNAELMRAKIREGCASIEALRSNIVAEHAGIQHPRWIRINSIKSSLDEQLATTFGAYDRAHTIQDLLATDKSHQKLAYVDQHIPNLIAVPPANIVTNSKAYADGQIILQDKASCFPAYLLDYDPRNGMAIDACAAPGNKTTHLAAIAHDKQDVALPRDHRIIACEKDKARSQVLAKMTLTAGAQSLVKVRAGQNFLKLDPHAQEFANVNALLLDPSCSGSGIVGRDEGSIHVHIPSRTATRITGKKRKREQPTTKLQPDKPVPENENEAVDMATRLASLADFQLRLLQHAMAFPAAERITYSTCSIHATENENVVCSALQSDIATRQGWRVLLRHEQVTGMKTWHMRGDHAAVATYVTDHGILTTGQSTNDIADACIRCEKSGKDGTMGFFVAAFTREKIPSDGHPGNDSSHGEDDWDGFD